MHPLATRCWAGICPPARTGGAGRGCAARRRELPRRDLSAAGRPPPPQGPCVWASWRGWACPCACWRWEPISSAAGPGFRPWAARLTEWISRGSFCVFLVHIFFLKTFAHLGLTAQVGPGHRHSAHDDGAAAGMQHGGVCPAAADSGGKPVADLKGRLQTGGKSGRLKACSGWRDRPKVPRERNGHRDESTRSNQNLAAVLRAGCGAASGRPVGEMVDGADFFRPGSGRSGHGRRPPSSD